jgi:hypothetical protein
MDLRTSYRDTFIPLKPSSARNIKRNTSNDEQVVTRRPMNAISQTSFDFRPYPNYRPSPPVEMEPFLSQITIGNSFTPSITLVFDLIPRKKKKNFFSYRIEKVNIVLIMKVLIPVYIIVNHLHHIKINKKFM